MISKEMNYATKDIESSEKQDDAQIENADLESNHIEFLIARHGTTDLDPIPPPDPSHPLNWPTWRKNTILVIFAFHGSMAGFLAAGLVSILPLLAEGYHSTIEATTYFPSTSIVLLGVTPFLWLPLMNRVGHYPCLMVSVLGATAGNIGSIFCTSYGTQMLCRCVVAIFISPPCALGSIVVTRLFFRHERATKTGIWKSFFTAGAPAGPLIMGFVAKHAGLKWVFGVMAITSFVLFLAYLSFGREFLLWKTRKPQKTLWSLLGFGRVDLYPWSWQEALTPVKVFRTLRIIVPACTYAIVFAYANVAIAITVPQVAGIKFHLDSQGIGLQFIAMIIGLAMGEIMGGVGSDYWMKRMGEIPNRTFRNEDRLWLAYPGFAFSATGLIIWGITTQQAMPGKWIVTPSIGAAIAYIGCQLTTTVLVTYAVDVNPVLAGQTGLVINLLRQLWAFIGPFYYTPMFKKLHYGGTGGVMAAIVGVVPTAAEIRPSLKVRS